MMYPLPAPPPRSVSASLLLLSCFLTTSLSFHFSPSLTARRAPPHAVCARTRWGHIGRWAEEGRQRNAALSVGSREAGVEEERSEEEGLPEDWRTAVDGATGRTYFWNVKTRESTWYRPSSEKTLLRAARRLKEGDGSVEGEQRRKAAQRRAAQLQQKLAAAESQKEMKYMTRSPTKFVQKRMQGVAGEERQGDAPLPPPLLSAADPFSSFLNLLERREQPPVDYQRMSYEEWLEEATISRPSFRLEVPMGSRQ
ncbi:hypothetical protein GUITHDRAFT_149670, partial [Guillardia theta CCMP2712]